LNISFKNIITVCSFTYDYLGDDYCEDDGNTAVCGYDGGDCCLDLIDDSYCNECICHETGLVHTEAPSGVVECLLKFIGDGACDDDNNYEECNWDGGDCCEDAIVDWYCNECICHLDGLRHPSA
jgi:hypothetical protein